MPASRSHPAPARRQIRPDRHREQRPRHHRQSRSRRPGRSTQANGGDYAGVYFWNADGQVLTPRHRHPQRRPDRNARRHSARATASSLATDAARTRSSRQTDVPTSRRPAILLNGAGLTADVHDSHVTGRRDDGHRPERHPDRIGRDSSSPTTRSVASGYGNPMSTSRRACSCSTPPKRRQRERQHHHRHRGDGDAGVYFVDSDAPVAHRQYAPTASPLASSTRALRDAGRPTRQYLHPRRRERHQRWLLPDYDRDHGLYLSAPAASTISRAAPRPIIQRPRRQRFHRGLRRRRCAQRGHRSTRWS